MPAPGRVIVVGAGPVGCTAAAVLARRGATVTLMEAEPELPLELRASTFHPATLDLLDDLGVVGELIDRGLVARHFAYRDLRGGVMARFDLGAIADVTAHPYRLQCEQFKLCQILVERFEADPLVELSFGAPVASAADRGDGAVVRLADGSQHAADFVVAADGAGSAVRKSLGLAFDGMTYEDRYLVVSTPCELADHLHDLCYVNYVSGPDRWLVLLRTAGVWRALFPVGEGQSDADALSEANVQRLLHGVVDLPGHFEVAHRTVYAVHQRVAETFRAGRVLLAGDAAHINNPLGGMGMNGGIHDAFLFGHAVASALAGDLPEDRLEAMAGFRRRMAVDYVQRHTHDNALTLTAPDPARRSEALARMAAVAADPDSARDYVLQASMTKARWLMDDLLAEARAGGGEPAQSEEAAR